MMKKLDWPIYRANQNSVSMYQPDARQRQPTKCDVQLPFAGGSSAAGPPVAAGTADGGHSAGGSVASVQSDVCGIWTSVDSARETVAGFAAAGSVHDSQ